MSFSRVPANHELAEINSQSVSKMKAIKLLGMHIQSDLKWNTHILETVKKATKQLFFLVQLIRAEVSECELVKFYVACIQSVLLYGCQTFLTNFTTSSLIRRKRVFTQKTVYECCFQQVR